MLQSAFTDPLGGGDQLLPAITTLDGIRQVNELIAFPANDFFGIKPDMEEERVQVKREIHPCFKPLSA